MAVINSPQIGIARGKLGDAVYYRSKGNTNARSYNPNTTNRRTVRQQTQRSLFSSAVKFFSRGVQNLFVFAYEDKRTQESDYNAFMRYNIKRGMYFGPQQNEDPDYPALGRFILTQGSLQRMDSTFSDDGVGFREPGPAVEKQYDLVSQLSEDLILYANYQQGDILTFLSITTSDTAGSPSAPITINPGGVNWIIRQLIVDVSDNRSLAPLGFTASVNDEDIIEVFSGQASIGNSPIAACAVIHSRIVNGKLRVSDSELSLNTAAVQALNYGKSDQWKSVVDAEWGTEQLSILQGGVARQATASVTPAIINLFDIPSQLTDIQQHSTIILGEYSINDVIEHLKLVIDESSILTASARGETGINFYDGSDLVCWAFFSLRGSNTLISWREVEADYTSSTLDRLFWD